MNRSNFVNSLKNVQNHVSAAKVKREHKEMQFDIPNSASNPTNTPKSFDGEIVDDSDPHFPQIRLVNRYMSRDELAKAIPPHTDSLTITQLYKQVSPPDFKRPLGAEANFTIFGIVATRSETKTSAQGNKYVTMVLSDLKYDITLALHGKAHEKYWKIQPGTLVGVFNPQFWISKTENTRTLNLSVNKLNCILEVGQASDLGQCEAMTTSSKSSKRCKNWVDVRKTHYCEYHIEQKAMKTKRPELSAQNAKLWDPKQIGKYSGSRMSVFMGGEVKWKQGLQVDNQVPKFQTGHEPFGGFPDAPVGRVFASETSQRKRSGKYDDSLAEIEKRKQHDKRKLERATEDSLLRAQLNRSSVPQRPTDRVTKPSVQQRELRKLGFSPIVRPSSAPKPSKITIPPQTESSDSELEII